MKMISEYRGNLLNHAEALYRPGESKLVVEFAEALGWAAVELTFAEGTKTLISIHPNPDDRDSTNNVMFLSEMSPAQVELEDLLAKKVASDPELSRALDTYKEKAAGRASGIPHLGFRYPSAAALDAVVDRLKNLSPALQSRVKVTEMPPYKPMGGLPDIRQVFVYFDVFLTGPSVYGQLIELQIDRAKG